jgi:hypothetical protein
MMDKEKVAYIHNEHKILSFVAVWMELEDIVLSKIRQAQKEKYPMFSLICGICKSCSNRRREENRGH